MPRATAERVSTLRSLNFLSNALRRIGFESLLVATFPLLNIFSVPRFFAPTSLDPHQPAADDPYRVAVAVPSLASALLYCERSNARCPPYRTVAEEPALAFLFIFDLRTLATNLLRKTGIVFG